MLQPRDLDLYVPIANKEAAEEFLEELGYSICQEPNHSMSEYENTSAIHISRYAKGRRTIDIAYTTGSPIQAVVEFHLTLVMSYIAWYGLVCLYPVLTLQKRAVINVDNKRAREHHKRYEARGFQLTRRHTQRPSDKAKQECCQYFECPSTVRSILDKGVMFVPFGGIRDNLSLYERDIVWRLNNNTCGGVGLGFTASETSEYLLK